MTDIFKTLQDNIIKLVESEETDFLPLVKSVYGDTPEAVLKGALFASYIYKKGNKKQKKILLECDSELKEKGSRKHIKQFNQMFPVVSEKKSTTKTAQSTPESHIVLTEEIYKANIENSVRTKELELRELHNEEKALLQAQIDELNNRLADVPKAFEELQKRNVELVARLEQMGSKTAEKKFQKAVDAFNENEFAKADKILMEIEETEKLNKKDFGSIAHSRGNIAEQDVRWKDAAEHYARAVQLDPSFDNLIRAQELAIAIGNYDSALSLGLAAKKAAIAEHGEESYQHALVLHALGASYREKGQYKKSEPFYQQAIEINKIKLGETHPQTALNMGGLAMVYEELGKYEDAEFLFKNCLEIVMKTLGDENTHTASTINNLAGLYKRQERYTDAEQLYQQALNINMNIFGESHPHTATNINNIADIYTEQGKYEDAEKLHWQAQNIYKELLGENHPNIAASNNNIAMAYVRQGRYKDADPLFEKAVKLLETTLGDEHPNTKGVRKNYEKNKIRLANAPKTTPQ